MARRLLDLVDGLEPQEYHRRAHEQRFEQVEVNKWLGIPNEMARLAFEIKCQNGAEIITAFLSQLTEANPTGRPICEVDPKNWTVE
jgi:hypothetical protein